jgi:hypothetical protein
VTKLKKITFGSLIAEVYKFGDGYVILVGGGDIHIGAVSLGEPYTSHKKASASVSTLTRYSHRDDAISSLITRELVSHLHCPVIVIAGFHQDSLSREEIAQVLEHSSKLSELLIDNLSNNSVSSQQDSA